MPTIRRSPVSYSDQTQFGQSTDLVGSRRNFVVVVVLLLLIAIGGGVYYFFFLRDSTTLTDQKQIEKIQDLVAQVGKLIDLPAGEEPTIATVSNLEALKGQEFFARAELGDKVLVYPKARKAILYSPTKNKIIEVAPLNIPADNAGSLDLQKDTSDSL